MFLGNARLAFVKKIEVMGLICKEGPSQLQKVQDILDLLFTDGDPFSLLDQLTASRFHTEWTDMIEFTNIACSYTSTPVGNVCTGTRSNQMKDNYQYGKLIHDCSVACTGGSICSNNRCDNFDSDALCREAQEYAMTAYRLIIFKKFLLFTAHMHFSKCFVQAHCTLANVRSHVHTQVRTQVRNSQSENSSRFLYTVGRKKGTF